MSVKQWIEYEKNAKMNKYLNNVYSQYVVYYMAIKPGLAGKQAHQKNETVEKIEIIIC